MFDRLIARTAAVALAALVTVSIVGSLSLVADQQHGLALLAASGNATTTAQAASAQPAAKI
jgi:hypothetical protein